MKYCILVATHKSYWMPSDSIYLPIHVGKANKSDIGFIGDNSGKNISSENPYFCELTGLYWAWKNINASYLGLVHYRRHFTMSHAFLRSTSAKQSLVLSSSQLKEVLKQNDIIVPNKRRYYIETNYSHYIHAHHREGLDQTREIIAQSFPEYLSSFDLVMKRTWAHMFNMFIMKRPYADAYCEWLFSILFKLREELDTSDYSASEARVFGYVSELLLDVWIEKNGLAYREVNVMFMENQNWLVKGGKFLKRKLSGDYR